MSTAIKQLGKLNKPLSSLIYCIDTKEVQNKDKAVKLTFENLEFEVDMVLSKED